MKFYTFVFINFLVSFLSDIVLNDIANPPKPISFNSKIIDSLKPYFKNKSIIISGIYAGITICITLIGVSLLSKIIYNFYVPNTLHELFKYLVLAFPIGYIVDIGIDKLHIFGNSLVPYYKIAGAGFWGAIAFIFSIIISFLLQKYLIPIL
tara:strand:+ start:2102 stop:2554 length:453 start_codon:yes stop_codon:yes gene_type:complete